jgi:hypothetical protein
MRYLRAVIVLVALVGFPAAAFASTPATQSQKRALTKAAGDTRVPPRCLTARISTADRSYAEVYFTGLWGAGQRMPSGCGKYAANGVTIFHARAGHWHSVTSGSSFVTSSGGCRVPHVPTPVVTDFRLCGSLTPRLDHLGQAPRRQAHDPACEVRVAVRYVGTRATRGPNR